MASNKKPSMYSNRGAIGSAEELETYGVWVKSEPQDFTASLAEAASFNADALPYEADFDTGFDNMGTGTAGFDLLDAELHIPEISVDDDGITADAERGSEEASTQMLMKIANELSSIRSELNTLKREFAEIRGEAGAEAKTGDTDIGDGMESFFNTTDFPTEEEIGFDIGREADEAALKEIEEQNKNENENETEEIPIDFDNLGLIDLDGGAEAPQEELPPLEGALDDDDFEMPSFDPLSFEEAPPSEPDDLEEVQGFAEELVPLEGEDEELKELRIEGAESLASPPDNADYLEADPFVNVNALSEEPVLADALSDDVSEESAQPEEAAVAEITETETADSDSAAADLADSDLAVADSAVADLADSETATATAGEGSEDLALGDLSFDEASFDLGLDSEPAPDDSPVDLSEAVIDEPNLSEEIVEPPLEEPVLGDISFEDDISLDMGDFGTEVDAPAEEPVAEETGDTLDAPVEEPAAEETVADPFEIEVPADEPVAEEIGDIGDITLDVPAEEPAAEETEADPFELEVPAEEPVAEEIGEIGDIGDIGDTLDVPAEEPAAEETVADPFEIDVPAEDIVLDVPADEPVAEEVGTDIVLDDVAVIDLGEDALDVPAEEPAAEEIGADDLGAIDLGEDIALDVPAEEPAAEEIGADDLGTVDLGEDIALDTQIEDIETVDFGADLEPEPKDTGKAAAPANDIISDIDDSVIPEGLEVNAKEADPSLDDDLEAFAGELAITEDESPADSDDKLADESGEFAAIPTGLKNELKNVLSYMDHLLESLPEEKIEEFAQSEYFDKYKKIFKELGLV